jgi:hypothetical protein
MRRRLSAWRQSIVIEFVRMQARDIFGLEGLAELGARNGVDMRPNLLRVLTDLYVHRLSHTPAEERHYTELALRLLEAVDVATRVAVARRLAHYLSPPHQIMQWLARDLPQVTAELRSNPLQAPAAAAPAAPNFVAPVADAPASFAKKQLSADLPRVIDAGTARRLNDLFFAADAAERRLILLHLNIVAPVAAGSIRVSRDQEHLRELEAAGLSTRTEEFARLLARTIYIPHEQARRIVGDDSGEAIVAAAKTLSMARGVLYRILMFLNPAVGHSVGRVHALAALYDELTRPAAEGMVAIWQALPGSESTVARHRPLAWDDEMHRRARPTTSARRSSTAAPALPARLRRDQV